MSLRGRCLSKFRLASAQKSGFVSILGLSLRLQSTTQYTATWFAAGLARRREGPQSEPATVYPTGPRTKYVTEAQNFGSAPNLRRFGRPAHGSYRARSARRKIEPGPFKTEPEVRRTPCTCTTSRTRAKTHAERPRQRHTRQNSRGDRRTQGTKAQDPPFYSRRPGYVPHKCYRARRAPPRRCYATLTVTYYLY